MSGGPEHAAVRAHGPIFIVGCPRSGTTLMRAMLDSHPRIACGPETLFLQDLVRMDAEHWHRLQRFGVDRQTWRHHHREMLVWLHTEYARHFDKPRWADKSPGYALILDEIDELFPDAQVLHVIRDGRDVVASWTTRWGARSVRAAIAAWPRHILSARRWGGQQSEDRYREVRYEQLVADPRQVLSEILEWLGEPWDDAVLRFGETRHHLGEREFKADERSDEARFRRLQGEDRSKVFRSEGSRPRRPEHLLQRRLLRYHAGALLRELDYR